LIPTWRFWLLIAIGIPISAACVEVGQPWLAVAFDALAIGMAWLTTRMTPGAVGLSVKRRFDAVLSVRVPNKIELEVENVGDQPVSGVLRDECPPQFRSSNREFRFSIEPGRVKTFSYTLTPNERGSDYFRSTVVRLDCPLGLVSREETLPTEQPVRVYPNVLALREFDLLKQKGQLRELGIRKSRVRGLGTEFESLRDYAEGDDYRKIDWKATARRGKLVVRQYEQERSQSVVLCIDVGRHMLSEVNGITKLDHALDACLMLANAAVVAGDQIGLLVYSDTVERYIPPRKGRGQLGIVVEGIHDLMPVPVESNTAEALGYLSRRWKRRSLVVCFTDSGNSDRSKELVRAFGSLTHRHIMVAVRVSDPKIEEVIKAPVEAANALYRRAAALQVDEDRRAATAVLSAGHVHNVVAEPQDLVAALLSFYFEVKERSLL